MEFKANIDTKQKIEFLDKFSSPIRTILNPGGRVVIATDVENVLTKQHYEADSRFEAYKDEAGWHVFLIAEFKNVGHYGDVSKIFHFNLCPASPICENSKMTLRTLIATMGQWGLIDYLQAINALNGTEIKALVLPRVKNVADIQTILNNVAN